MIDIRDEVASDRSAVEAVISSAFGRPAEAQLVNDIYEDGDDAVSLVADDHGHIVGHLLLSRIDGPFPALALGPISVTPPRQRTGIGSLLIRSAIDRARTERWAAIFVLGEPAFYERFGFDRDAAAGFTSPYAGRHFMMLELWPALPAFTGELHHAAAFAKLEGA